MPKNKKEQHENRFSRNALFRNRSLTAPFTKVEPEEPEVVVESFKPLEHLEAEIQERIITVVKNKQEILRLLYVIYYNREHYFEDKPQYRDNFLLYLKERFSQALSTAYDDLKIIKLLGQYESGEILDRNIPGLIYKLKRIAQLKSEERQLECLQNIDEIQREDIVDLNLPPKVVIRYKNASGLEGVKTTFDRTKQPTS